MIRGVMRADRREWHRRPSEAVLQVQPADDEVREEWVRKTDDPGIRNVSAVSVTPPGDSETLVRAAAEVVDDLEDRIRAFMYGGDG